MEQSYTQAAKWFRKAAEKGVAPAQNDLGVCYAKGQGVEKSMTEAAKWWKLAAEQGNKKAKENLAKMSAKNMKSPKANLYEDPFIFPALHAKEIELCNESRE